MTKREIVNYIQFGLWVFSLIGLLLVIVIPKTITTVDSLFYVFIALYIVMPVLLSLTKIVTTYYDKQKDNNFFDIMTFIGTATIMPMMLIYFISSINKDGKLIMIILSSIIVIYNVIAIFLVTKKVKGLKLYLGLLIISLVLYLINIYVALQVSYNYSIVW